MQISILKSTSQKILCTYKQLISEVVSRNVYGRGAEGNGETPAGKKCRVRPHRTQSEEAHRAPAESELFPAVPIH
ncbi:hypothetical protein HFA01_05300 [Halobacillus faecis]|uniref:Uncharacterized protein n=1 Tax=Halobacillus faecis TaxID=360184 RepID=A0A511WPU4_9BACI|nr:hypothetical protein HFA01_05300 [Halobacillus faecis]